jgi:hypothetical protein
MDSKLKSSSSSSSGGSSSNSNSSNSGSSSREELLRSTKELCNVFANHGTIEEIISCFSSKIQSNDNNNNNNDNDDNNDNNNNIRLFEHGLPELAPFIGRSFYGIQGIKDYFTIISNTLEYEDMIFCDYIVDVEKKVVSVRGKAKFIWKSTKKSWNEIFIYRIQLDNEYKILIYEVWADSGAAYLASQAKPSQAKPSIKV